ncbi:MAG: hypothetical protein L0H35_06705, partial [Psychrobacter sp.]|nr:hypothetical protein [Psychrobacter sp.]
DNTRKLMPDTYYFIDNPGKGTCMYYASATSLMYTLRHDNDPLKTDRIFTLLSLSDPIKNKLQETITKTLQAKRVFNAKELGYIQYTLGPACRRLAADKTIEEYKRNPEASPITANACYSLRKAFLTHTETLNKSTKLKDPQSNLNYFVGAELYCVDGYREKIMAFIEKRKDAFMSKLQEHTKPGLNNDGVISALIQEEATALFADEAINLLEDYRAHLNTDKRWGSDETLFALHRAITNEKMIGEENKRQFKADNLIELNIALNGNIPVSASNTSMIINYHYNLHWTSMISDDLLATASLASKQTLRAVSNKSTVQPTSWLLDALLAMTKHVLILSFSVLVAIAITAAVTPIASPFVAVGAGSAVGSATAALVYGFFSINSPKKTDDEARAQPVSCA